MLMKWVRCPAAPAGVWAGVVSRASPPGSLVGLSLFSGCQSLSSRMEDRAFGELTYRE
jgi:hypothetical protein